MKILATACLTVLGGLALIVSHRVTAQVENVKLVEDDRLVSTAPAAQLFADEQTIRTLVDRQNRGEQPLKGTDAFVGESAAVSTLEQPNPATHERITRLVVAQSGELAYEYGNYTSGLVAPESKAESLDGAYLRVWRKQNGEWLVDAAFVRP